MIPRPAKKIVVLGMMSRMPVAGVVWQTMHYLEGFRRLGFDPYYVEAHARTPSMLMRSPDSDGSIEAATFIASVMRRFGFDHRWAFQALHSDGACYGLSEVQLQELYDSSEVIINLHGGTVPRSEHSRTGRLVLLETDPVELQIQLYEENPRALEFLEPHTAFFTFGELYGTPECLLPVTGQYTFRPTRQPVVIDFWNSASDIAGSTFTTIGNWRQLWRRVRLNGEFYEWSKHYEFLKFIDLPARTSQPFELALASCTAEDCRMLEAKGWRVREALSFSTELDSYRDYIQTSRGEFTVAKDQNVRMRTGWFSDRSVTYLAAGRPVITQETGFSRLMPTGKGLFAFLELDHILAAVDRIRSAYAQHARDALALAHEYFSHEVVLKRLLADVGV